MSPKEMSDDEIRSMLIDTMKSGDPEVMRRVDETVKSHIDPVQLAKKQALMGKTEEVYDLVNSHLHNMFTSVGILIDEDPKMIGPLTARLVQKSLEIFYDAVPAELADGFVISLNNHLKQEKEQEK